MTCPITAEGNLILVREFKQGRNDIVLEFPSGMLFENREMAIEAAQRELKEKTGFRAQRFLYLGTFWIDNRKSPTFSMAFIGLDCINTGKRNLDPLDGLTVCCSWRPAAANVLTLYST